jgi:hypothetical protein
MTMFPAEDEAGDERLSASDPASSGEAIAAVPAIEPSLPTEGTAVPPAAEPSPPADAVAPPRNPARSSFGDAFAALHDDGPQRHGAALRYSVELLAYYYAAQGRRNPAQEAIRTLVTDRFDILDTPQFGLYAPKGRGAAVADAGLRIMDALNAESVADPVWAGGADSTEAQRRADYAEQARGGRWVTDITGRHAILRDAQGRSVLAGSNISRVRLKGVPVVGFVMAQADQVQPSDDAVDARRDSAAPVTLGADGGDVSTGEFNLAQATGSPMRDAMNARPNGALPGDSPIDVGPVPGRPPTDATSPIDSVQQEGVIPLEDFRRQAMRADGRGDVVGYTNLDGSRTEYDGGTRAWRTRNPGAITYSPFIRDHGAIGIHTVPPLKDGTKLPDFAIFPDMETGRRAQRALLKTSKYQAKTIDDVIKEYSRTDVASYQKFVRETLKLSGTTPMRNLTSEQFDQLLKAMQRFEDTRPGTVREIPAPQ